MIESIKKTDTIYADTTAEIERPLMGPVSLKELEYIAFSGNHDITHGIFRSLSRPDRRHYASKYVLHQVLVGGIRKLGKYLGASAEEAANDEKRFIDETMDLFVQTCRDFHTRPRELFESLLLWGEELARLSLLKEALDRYNEASSLEISRFPDLFTRVLLGKADLLNMLGRFEEAQDVLATLAERPYVVSDRNLIPKIHFSLSKEALVKGDTRYYKQLLFNGLRYFYADLDSRRGFVDQICKTYRHSYNVLFDPAVSFGDKVSFAVHWLYFRLNGLRFLRLFRLTSVLRLGILGYVYCLNYMKADSLVRQRGREDATGFVATLPKWDNGRGAKRSFVTRKKKNILITRAMGGIGDLLMMTPGFHELRRKYPSDEIHLAIPERYFPLFHGNDDVKCLDIERDAFNFVSYKKWFNFTDCPAARIESRTAPKVKKTRIDIFARAMGLGVLHRRRMERRPKYHVSENEREYQRAFWKIHGLEGKTVIAIQLRSEEVYRNYPHMGDVVKRIADDFQVLLFDAEPIVGFERARVIKVEGLPLRKAFALVANCDAVVAPDSAFVHLAGALDIPCVALYGPIDGKMRTMHYPHCKFLDVRETLGCVPCWRNEVIPCKLTGLRTSVCMGDISVNEIHHAVIEALSSRRLDGSHK